MDVTLKAQFVHEHSQLLASLTDMARAVSEEDKPTSEPTLSPATNYLKTNPKVQDFVQLVSAVSS